MSIFSKRERAPRSQWHDQVLLARSFAMIGLGIVAIYSLSISSVRAFSVGAMVGAAAMLAGALLGFLFGIPRSMYYPTEASHLEDQQAQNIQAIPITVNSPPIRANTNLEQISDWLTKILVGISLTQIPAIGDAAGSLINEVAAGMTPGFTASAELSPAARSIAGAIVMYFLAIGFLMGFIVTRTSLPKIFSQADVEAVNARLAQAEQVGQAAGSNKMEQPTDELIASHLDHRPLTDRLRDQDVKLDSS